VRSRRARAWTGLALHADRTTVRNVLPDSPAWRAGLTFNDEIVAVEGARVTASTFGKRIADHAPGARVRVTFFRRDQLREATLTLGQSPERKLSVSVDPKSSPAAKAIRRGWFGV
jgi:predicted metalloprotease with PDZ domain